MKRGSLMWSPTILSRESIDKYPAEIKLDYDILKEKTSFNIGDIIPIVLQNKKLFIPHMPYFKHVYLAVIVAKKNIYPYDSVKYRPNYKIKFYYDGEIRQHTEEKLCELVKKSIVWLKRNKKGELMYPDTQRGWDLYWILIANVIKIQRAFRRKNKKKCYNGKKWVCNLQETNSKYHLLGMMFEPEMIDNIGKWTDVVEELNSNVLETNKVTHKSQCPPSGKYVDSVSQDNHCGYSMLVWRCRETLPDDKNTIDSLDDAYDNYETNGDTYSDYYEETDSNYRSDDYDTVLTGADINGEFGW